MSFSAVVLVDLFFFVTGEGGGWGGVLPYNSFTGMFRPTGSYFWVSDQKRGIIFKPFSRTGYNILNARKLQNIIGDFHNRTGLFKHCLFFRTGYHFGRKPFLKRRQHLEASSYPNPTQVSPSPPSRSPPFTVNKNSSCIFLSKSISTEECSFKIVRYFICATIMLNHLQ